MSAPKIPKGREWEFVRGVFKEHRLDPHDPNDWPIALRWAVTIARALAKALFAEYQKNQRGRQQEWTPERLTKLALDIARLQQKHPGKTKSDLCRFLSKEEGYSGQEAEKRAQTLRRRLQNRKNPVRPLDQLIERFDGEFWAGKWVDK